jgi:ATP-binding protein involved in chromosome partitioning
MDRTPEAVLDALRTVVDPSRGKDIVRLNMIRRLRVDDTGISFTVMLKDPVADFAGRVVDLCRQALSDSGVDGDQARVDVDNEMISLAGDLQMTATSDSNPLGEGVTNTIAVASGKGGVGKSTVAANLAVALAKQGFDVGLVDTDIYGPSVPTMFGVRDARPRVDENRKIIPIERYGVRLLSMGFLVDEQKAVIWRGPMVSSAVRQFLGDTSWGDLDYLVMDLPPGTGDIQLTIVQTVPLSGAIIVSTPQDVALADARKGVAMFQQVNVPVLGMVENMAYFTPPDLPDRRYHLFGEGGARRLSEELGVPFLGEIPIEQELREMCDSGEPVVASRPDSMSSRAFSALARETVRQVELRNADLEPSQKVEILYR